MPGEENFGESTRIVYAVHSSLMNGGFTAVEATLSTAEIDQAARAYEALGASAVAGLLRALAGAREEDIDEWDRDYLQEIPDDAALEALIDAKWPREASPDVPEATAEAVAQYVRLIEDWVAIQRDSNPTAANRAIDKATRVENALVESAEGRGALEELVASEDERIAVFASAAVGRWNLGLASARLTEIRDGGGPLAFDAKWTLRNLQSSGPVN